MLSLITEGDRDISVFAMSSAQHSSCWLLKCVCAVVKWPYMKLAVAFVSCQVLVWGVLALSDTMFS
jgi:hypothetical protein